MSMSAIRYDVLETKSSDETFSKAIPKDGSNRHQSDEEPYSKPDRHPSKIVNAKQLNLIVNGGDLDYSISKLHAWYGQNGDDIEYWKKFIPRLDSSILQYFQPLL